MSFREPLYAAGEKALSEAGLISNVYKVNEPNVQALPKCIMLYNVVVKIKLTY